MVGGNVGGFASIVEDCIFQFSRDKDYGPEFPDPDGACFKTLFRGQASIVSPWFMDGLWKSIYVVLNESRIRQNRRFRHFVPSYARLFNHQDSASNEWTLGIRSGKQPKLPKELRHAINAVVDIERAVYNGIINHIMFSPKIRFIDVNSAFAGHRFCEPTPEGTIDAQNANSWIYNLEWPGCVPLSENSNLTAESWPQIRRKCGGVDDIGEAQRSSGSHQERAERGVEI